jgi:LmbE family N-acetylglucosaminyl deacetylase
MKSKTTKRSKSILVIAAHPDDEVLGCGATIAKYSKHGVPVHCIIAAQGIASRVGISDYEAEREILELQTKTKEAHRLLGVSSTTHLNYPDNRMDSVDLLDVTQAIESVMDELLPTHVFTHQNNDVNIDHQILHNAVLAASRPQPGKSIIEVNYFEIQSSSEWRFGSNADGFHPNYFEEVTSTIDVKLAALECYDSEMRDFPHARSYHAVKALSEWRGASVGVNNAEAFETGRRIISERSDS